MELPCTESGNKYVIVFQDMPTKWPMVFPVPDQKSERIARLLCETLEFLSHFCPIVELIRSPTSCWMCVLKLPSSIPPHITRNVMAWLNDSTVH